MAPTVRGREYIVVSTPFLVIALVSLSFRLYTRICISKAPGWEDALVVFAFINAIGLFAILVHLAAYNGLGDRFLDLPPAQRDDFSGFLKRFWIGIFFYKVSISSSKASLFLQYIRLFPGWTKRASWVALGIVGGVFVANVCTNLFFCMPIDKFWDYQKPGHCLSRLPVWFSNAGANIATSIIAIALPIPAIWKLHFAVRTKIALISLFSIGIVDIIIAVCRLHSLRILSKGSDTTYNLRDVGLWSTLECFVAITCASIAVLRPLLAKLWPAYFSTGATTRGSRGTGAGRHTGHGTTDTSTSAFGDSALTSVVVDERSGRIVPAAGAAGLRGAAAHDKASRHSHSHSQQSGKTLVGVVDAELSEARQDDARAYEEAGRLEAAAAAAASEGLVDDLERQRRRTFDAAVAEGLAQEEPRRFVLDNGRVMEKGAFADHEVESL